MAHLRKIRVNVTAAVLTRSAICVGLKLNDTFKA
jgi:hypothetical protein